MICGSRFALAVVASGLVAGSAMAQEAVVESLRVFPAQVTLPGTAKARQLVVVQAVYADGITRDVTGQAQWTFANPALVRRDGNTLWPTADGQTELKIDFGG